MLVSPTKIAGVFARCRQERRAAFIPFLMAGDPNIQTSVELLIACAHSGADIVEVGFPYSDPLADGPTIQAAAQRALACGTSFAAALKIARRVHDQAPDTPLIGFTYYNPVFIRGPKRCAREFAAAGLSGIIVPDLPPMEAMPLLEAFGTVGLAVTLLVAPSTPAGRAASIAALCSDFVYVVSRPGVTGADHGLREGAARQVTRLREFTDKPLALGFGVASPQDAGAVAAFADGVIIGSALIDRLAGASTSYDAVEEAKRFCREVRVACKQGCSN